MARKYQIRTIRNLLAAVILLTFFWWIMRCPLHTNERELHRFERTHLLDPSAIVCACEGQYDGEMSDCRMLVGVSPHTVQTLGRVFRIHVWPRNPEGATLVVLPNFLEFYPRRIAVLAAADPPVLAAHARLMIDMTVYEGGKVYTAEGERNRDVFLFYLEEVPGVENILQSLLDAASLPPYTLDFFSADGTLLETVTNIND